MNDEKILPLLTTADNAETGQFFERDAIAVFGRAPVAGQVKSRLAQKVGAEKAALLYAAMLRDSLELAQQSAGGVAEVLVCHTPRNAFDSGFGNGQDSLAHFWNGARHAQCEGDLSARLRDCFAHLKKGGAQKILIIGSDAPDIPAAYLRAAFSFLDDHDLVFGPAEDGGFYLIGARRISAALFENVTWSSASTLATIRANAARHNWSSALLALWRDVDEIEDLHALVSRLELNPKAAPHTRGVLQI